jgi:hypothetical protein
MLQKFLDRYPFSSARVISRHFRISPLTVKEILRRELERKNEQKMVLHLLSNDQKKLRVDASWKLLSLLGMYAEHHSEGIATADESWFQYSSYPDLVFAGSRESVVPRIRRDISGRQNDAYHFLCIKATSSVESSTKRYKIQSELFH